MSFHLLQGAILGLSSCTAYLLAQVDPRVRRWGYVTSLCAQPLWVTTAAVHGQWGIGLLSVWFAWCAIKGIRGHWRL